MCMGVTGDMEHPLCVNAYSVTFDDDTRGFLSLQDCKLQDALG